VAKVGQTNPCFVLPFKGTFEDFKRMCHVLRTVPRKFNDPLPDWPVKRILSHFSLILPYKASAIDVWHRGRMRCQRQRLSSLISCYRQWTPGPGY
jgi:hypothetical protein